MAFHINVKQREGSPATANKAKNILEDIRVFVVLMLVACIGLIVFTVLGAKSNEKVRTDIAKQAKVYEEGQASIANLKALQARSAEFEAQRDTYDAMIPETQNSQSVMIEMEHRVEAHGCILAELNFGGDAAIGKEGSKSATETSTGSGLVKELQVLMTVRGSYTDIMQLCSELVTDEELMRIDAIQLRPQAHGEQEAVITLMKFSEQ